jgi:alpha-beta hydrolase superfamily lysophospholipase
MSIEANKQMKKQASILFVHGAGHAAWCWREHFTGWFEARGYTVAAPDLPYHGSLPRRGITFTPLSAYVKAVAQAVASLEPPLILIGHSMGGFILQKYLEREEADLAVLLASTPPTGASGIQRDGQREGTPCPARPAHHKLLHVLTRGDDR